MSDFSPAWLALREPADTAARNRDVLAACTAAFADQTQINVCDIGAGTGASVRALADLLPAIQTWTLVDHDTGNLSAALTELARWGENPSQRDDVLQLQRGTKHLTIHIEARDLAETPACWPENTDLVTASALFDLVSTQWLGRFAELVAIDRLPLLSMLTFDGLIATDPAHPSDEAVAAAFRLHQARDKGFGPAAGARAATILEDAFVRHTYTITAGDSPWHATASHAAFRDAAIAGIVTAAKETETLAGADVERWARACLDEDRTLIVGHRDLFAYPKG